MPPRRRGAGGKRAAKKVEVEDEPEAGPSAAKQAMLDLVKSEKGKKKKTRKPDSRCPLANTCQVIFLAIKNVK